LEKIGDLEIREASQVQLDDLVLLGGALHVLEQEQGEQAFGSITLCHEALPLLPLLRPKVGGKGPNRRVRGVQDFPNRPVVHARHLQQAGAFCQTLVRSDLQRQDAKNEVEAIENFLDQFRTH
jgi:hypothetical protein